MKEISNIKKVQFNDVVIVNGYIWGVSNITSSLFRIKLDTYEVEIVAFLGDIVEENFYPSGLFVRGNTLYITMFNNSGLITYNMSDGDVKAHNMCQASIPYSRALLYENSIYIVPRNIKNEIIIYDLSSQKSIQTYAKPIDPRKEDLVEDGQIIAPIIDREYIWSIIVGTNKLISIHAKSKRYQIYELEYLSFAVAFFIKGNEFWVLDKNDLLVVFDKDTMNVKRVKQYECFQGAYSHMILLEDKIVFVPMYGCKLYSCNFIDLELEEFEAGLVEDTRIADGSLYYSSMKYNKDTYFFPCKTNILLTYNEEDKVIKKRELCFKDCDLTMPFVFGEKTRSCLTDYMNMNLQMKKMDKRIDNKGKTIFDNLKEE